MSTAKFIREKVNISPARERNYNSIAQPNKKVFMDFGLMDTKPEEEYKKALAERKERLQQENRKVKDV